jgi:hypothetical protein
MDNSTRVMRWPRRAWPAAVRTAVTVLAAGVMVLLAAACSSPPSTGAADPSSTAGGTAGSPSAVAYSACMRSHGVPSFPDPGTSGQIPKGDAQEFGVSTSVYQAAQADCQHLIPTAGSLHQEEYQCMQNADCPSALVQQMLTADWKLAQCMRTHGVPNFPDPTTDSSGPVFNISAAGISDAASHSTQFENELTECSNIVGGNAPQSFE